VSVVLPLQLYQWSTAVVASYSFVLGDDHFQAMVPVWDLLNHITGQVNVKLSHDEHKGVLQVRGEGGGQGGRGGGGGGGGQGGGGEEGREGRVVCGVGIGGWRRGGGRGDRTLCNSYLDLGKELWWQVLN
jgi:hypothetical protein